MIDARRIALTRIVLSRSYCWPFSVGPECRLAVRFRWRRDGAAVCRPDDDITGRAAFGDRDRRPGRQPAAHQALDASGFVAIMILFQNPGQGNRWLSVKLVGRTTNRAAIGARIKVVTAGSRPLTIHRHVSSGSSFGANPLEQHIGLAHAEKVAVLEVHWPTSRTTQVFHDLAANQAIEVVEQAETYRKVDHRPIPLPASE